MELYGQLVFKEMKICLYGINFETHDVDFSSGNQTFLVLLWWMFSDVIVLFFHSDTFLFLILS